MTGSHLFIADLHLEPSARRISRLAMRFFAEAHGIRQLYILGDLFEYWLGDDAGLLLYENELRALRQLSDSGCKVTIMLGNRDFLLGDEFARHIGATLVTADELVITLGETPVLLMHGDTLCTDDTDYQRFRQSLRKPRWRTQFLEKSIDERREQAEALRVASRGASRAKPAEIMDVNCQAVSERLSANGCQILIHGHTHRPAEHMRAQTDTTRLVVGDWHKDHAQYVQWSDAEGFALKTFHDEHGR
ncbi:MAG: UDP-2,3-diacylglucosamine diphosphatase [Granulosicoccus sp.]|nr:UDP-2,3-diacylglucosamine diphosphatase [Granulosicoccus sp.]